MNTNMAGFRSLRPCVLDKSNLSIGSIKHCPMFVMRFWVGIQRRVIFASLVFFITDYTIDYGKLHN